MTFSTDTISDYVTQFIRILVDYSPRLISAFLILFIGIYVIRLINRLVKNIMLKRELEPTLSKFLADILFWFLRIMLFVTVISRLGIETSSFVAILGAGGLAIGLSLQGSLSNFAGGMLIIMFKPFRVGDTIEAQGVTGTVSEIQIFVTKLVTGNNQMIFIPNGSLSNGNIINYSMAGTRRADLVFSVAYNTDLKLVKGIILQILKNNPMVLEHPEPTVAVTDLTDSSVKLAIRPWATIENYGTVCSDTLESCKTELYNAGVEIQPYVRESSINKL